MSDWKQALRHQNDGKPPVASCSPNSALSPLSSPPLLCQKHMSPSPKKKPEQQHKERGFDGRYMAEAHACAHDAIFHLSTLNAGVAFNYARARATLTPSVPLTPSAPSLPPCVKLLLPKIIISLRSGRSLVSAAEPLQTTGDRRNTHPGCFAPPWCHGWRAACS